MVCIAGCVTAEKPTPVIVSPAADPQKAAKPAVSPRIYQGPVIQQDVVSGANESDQPVKSEFDSVLLVAGVIFLGLLGIIAVQHKKRKAKHRQPKHKHSKSR